MSFDVEEARRKMVARFDSMGSRPFTVGASKAQPVQEQRVDNSAPVFRFGRDGSFNELG